MFVKCDSCKFFFDWKRIYTKNKKRYCENCLKLKFGISESRDTFNKSERGQRLENEKY